MVRGGHEKGKKQRQEISFAALPAEAVGASRLTPKEKAEAETERQRSKEAGRQRKSNFRFEIRDFRWQRQRRSQIPRAGLRCGISLRCETRRDAVKRKGK
jgi:hypothetical protein